MPPKICTRIVPPVGNYLVTLRLLKFDYTARPFNNNYTIVQDFTLVRILDYLVFSLMLHDWREVVDGVF